jgi:glutamate 5-kinase
MTRVVVKLGSSVVADGGGAPRMDVLAHVCDELARLHQQGQEAIIVTSGAIARGIRVMELPQRPSSIGALQAASAVGQGKLYRIYDELLRERGVTSAQVLLTFSTRARR